MVSTTPDETRQMVICYVGHFTFSCSPSCSQVMWNLSNFFCHDALVTSDGVVYNERYPFVEMTSQKLLIVRWRYSTSSALLFYLFYVFSVDTLNVLHWNTPEQQHMSKILERSLLLWYFYHTWSLECWKVDRFDNKIIQPKQCSELKLQICCNPSEFSMNHCSRHSRKST